MSNTILETKLKTQFGLTFDDVLLLPGYADFERKDIQLKTKLHPEIELNLPVCSSPMDTVTEAEMAIALAKNGSIGFLHRSLEMQDLAKNIQAVKAVTDFDKKTASLDKNGKLLVGATVGLGIDTMDKIKLILENEVNLIIVDSAHGHSKSILDLIKKIKTSFSEVILIGGNVATAKGAEALIAAGADVIRVGMGPGSICTTRIVTGMGVPQLTAISEVVSVAKKMQKTVIADGGIKQIGDIAKALAVGADCVMMGSKFAGYKESPSDLLEIDGKKYKVYRGMGSVSAMKKGAASRYGQAFDAKKLIAEGVEAVLPYQGEVVDFLTQIEGGLKASFYDVGAKTLPEFFEKAEFIKITQASLTESKPHSVKVTDFGESYLS